MKRDKHTQIMLALGVLLTASGWTLALHDMPTGVRRVRWFGPDGAELDAVCEHPDLGFSTLTFDGAAWVSCRASTAFPDGALARIDPAAGRAEVRWPQPGFAGYHHTIGLSPGPEGQLGIVHTVRTDSAPLAAGIAGREGWVRAPELLPGGERTHLLGAAWIDGALEVAFVPGDLRQTRATRPVIVRLTANERSERSPLAEGAEVSLAFYGGAERGWVFIQESGKQGVTWELPERGERTPSKWGEIDWPETRVDATAHGRIVEPLRLYASKPAFVLELDGSVTPFAPPEAPWELVFERRFSFRDGRLLRELLLRNKHQFRRQVDGEPILLEESESNLVLTAGTRRATVAELPSHGSCSNLDRGVFLPREAGGHWLVNEEGCYVELDASLKRADPLGLREHLRRGASDLNQWWNEWLLGWLLLGLPLCVGLGWLGNKGGGEHGFAVAAWVYAVVGAAALWKLWPLLT